MFHKPRPFAASLALLLLVATSSDFSPAQSKRPDFSGFWLRDDGGVIKISVNGTNVKAVHVKVVPENREVYGFVPGDTHFEGIAHGRTYTGKVMGHLAVAKWKKLCPGRWASWAENELTLSEDGTTLRAGGNTWRSVTRTAASSKRSGFRQNMFARQ